VYFEFANLLVFAAVAVGFVFANLLLSKLLLRPASGSEPGKLATYECGEPTIGQAWIRFDIRFYTVALMFVVFDVEVALLFPWGVVFRDLTERGLGLVAFVEAGTFILILAAGLAYVWARGDIEWTPQPGEATRPPTPYDRPAPVAVPAPARARQAAGAPLGGDRA
jgi:NADH-quinone oxidoreductase subunit A